MDELIKCIKEHLLSEEKDADAYRKMAAKAYEHDREDISQILNDIAYEESLHRKHLQSILEELEH